MVVGHVRVEGLAQLRRALRNAHDVEATRELREGLRRAADVVATEARSRVVSRTGRARDSIRPVMGGNTAFVALGKARVPYVGWLDFGTRNPVSGRARSVGPWTTSGAGPRGGRFVYPALDAKDREVAELVGEAVEQALSRLFDQNV